MIQVTPSLQEVDFQLESGNPIRIKIVDPLGKPVPSAYVGIGQWRGTEAIYNEKHPNVSDSDIPRRADEDGIYTWDWAPADGVQYRIGAKGYDVKEVTLVAKDDAHLVELAHPITIFGKVVDAESGTPIEQFRVIPVKAYRPDFYSTDFQASSVAEGKDGEYTIQIGSHGQTGNRYRVRIEAEGYRTAFGQKSLEVGDPPLEEDFKLERAPALVGVVLDPGGTPVNEFTVAVGTATTSPHFHIDRPDDNFGVAFQVHGTSEFKLPATFEPQRIRIFNEAGFTEVLRQPNEPIGTITLQPWASVSGRLVQDGTPISSEWISFFPLVDRGLTEARFQDSFSAKTDLEGHFRFDRLPPMSGTVKAYLGPWEESKLTSSRSVPIDLKPGDRKEVSLGGEGVTITGRVVATGRSNDTLSKNWSLNYLISRDRGLDYPSEAKPLSFSATGPLDTARLRQPDFDSWLATRENYFVKLAEDGRLRIHGVQPGVYDLVIQLYEQPAGCLVETIGEKVVPITIANDQIAAAKVELGDIEVECQIGPRVGSDMRAFKFTDSDGRVRFVDEMNGRYVLFHVWASWCQPCLESMPEVKATVEQYARDPLTAVGLNIDEDTSAAKALAKEGQWSWSQNYLGADSDMMRQLGISSVPAYYLIGPEGKLVGSANAWSEIEQLLIAELR
jgi:thiol-disulfide isomerase/thioredoxin